MVRPKLGPKLLRIAKVLLLVPAAVLAFTCFTGRFTKHIESAGRAQAFEIPERRLQWNAQVCEMVQWNDLCGNQLPAGRCFRIQPQTASVCELLGPGNSEEPSLLLGDGFVTLQTEGSLRITGNLRVRSARFEAETISFEDARVEARQASRNINAQGGGTFHSTGAITLERSNVTVTSGGALWGGGFAAGGDVTFLEASSLKVTGSVAAQDGGGLHIGGSLRLRGGSEIMVESASAARHGGGLFAHGEVVITENSLIRVRQTRALGIGGGFMSDSSLTVSAGSLDLEHTTARSGGGFATNGSFFASDGAAISIHSSKAGVSGGGFLALGQFVSFTNRSSVVMQDVRAKQFGGGFLAAFGSVIFGGMSEMTVVNGHATRLDGGGFASARQLEVDGGSTIRLRNVSAGRAGGGFAIRTSRARVRGHSRVMISDSHADASGGGLYVAILEVSDNAAVSIQNSSAEVAGGGLYVCGCNLTWARLGGELVVVSKSSFLSIQGTRAQLDGGGVYAYGAVVVAGASNVVVSDSHSVRGQGGGFYAKRKVQVVDGSMLRFRHVSAGDLGGAFGIVVPDAESLLVVNESGLSIDGATAGTEAGGFFAADASSTVVIAGYSKLVLSDCHAQKGRGGGFMTSRLQITDHAAVLIQNCWASGTGFVGGGFHAVFQYHETLETVLVANSSVLSVRAGKAMAGGGFLSAGKVLVTDASKLEASECHAREGGGFSTSALQVTGRSSVSIENATATSDFGGFRSQKRVVVSDGSTISLRGTMAGRNAGGFGVFGPLVLAGRSQLWVRNSFASTGCCGGFLVEQRLPDSLPAVQVTDGSAIHIDNATARLHAGGFFAERGDVEVSDGSRIRIQNVATAAYAGGFIVNQGLSVVNGSAIRIRTATAGQHSGGFSVAAEVLVESNSSIVISDAMARKGNSGGFAAGSLQVVSRSMIHIKRAQASLNGGGFFVNGQAVVTGHSEVVVSNSRAIEGHGGGLSTSRLYLQQNSTVDIRTTSAGQRGGGVFACGCVPNFASEVVLVADGSSLSVWNATAAHSGGGLAAGGQVVVAGWSMVAASYCHATSRDGGGVAAGTLLLHESSVVSIQKATAGQFGGGLYTEGSILVGAASTLTISNSSAELHGGGVYAVNHNYVSHSSDSTSALPGNLVLDEGMLIISDTRVKGLGAAAFVQDRLLVGAGSSLNVHNAVGRDLSSVVAAGCMHLSPSATVLLEDVVGGHGLDLRNADCSSACTNRTFEVASGASLTASGYLRSGLLALQTCPFEVVHLSHMHLLSWSSPVLSSYTRPHQVVVADVSIDYKPPLHDVLILATEDEFTVDSLDVSCKDCGHGVAFNASRSELRALSTPSLACPMAASVSKGTLQKCACADYQTTRKAYADREVVMLQDILRTCTFCEPHTSFINGTCRKCAPYSAWSDGKSDSCHFLPQDGTQLGALFSASASCVFLAFVFYQILRAPLVVVDAKSQRIPHRLRKAAGSKPFPDGMDQRSFSMSLQGPIVDLPQFLSRQLHRQLCYRVSGTGLQWLDFSPDNKKAVKIQSAESNKVEVQGVHVPYDCAAAIGALHATELVRLMLPLCTALFLAVLLPVVLQVAFMSGNGIVHVLVTAGYCALPVCLAALILHPAVAWLIDQRCHRTPFSKLLDEYRRRIHFDPHPGPDGMHPSKQGLMVLTLWELWGHFETFILDRNMHFVVNNMVRPLTRVRQVAFVSLWGGRQVDYFVSHSWGTSFAHFVRSIHCHALSREGQLWMDVSYWICSFANNQWDIEAELGETIMDSAFARTLRGDIKGVAMVLDHEVQPLTRVWCLFEFLLSKQLDLELVFATDVGVIGDDGCTSFDIALELGNKIESLQVVNCAASSDLDRTRIFEFIISSLGSLESMDEQIRDLMGRMLKKNLANVGVATSSLLQRLGHVGTD